MTDGELKSFIRRWKGWYIHHKTTDWQYGKLYALIQAFLTAKYTTNSKYHDKLWGVRYRP